MPKPRLARWIASLALVAFLSPACVWAGTDALRPGEYITEDGWGVLTLSTSGGRTMHFSLDAVGANGHTCSLEGEIENLKARLDVDEEGKFCEVTFRPMAGGIDVSSPEMELCRYFCGMRAGFEGEYLKPNPGCGTKERGATREQFQKLYDAKSYAKAAALLDPLLSRCSRTLDWLESAELRNDLAITQYHLGRLADCRKTLAPLMEEASKTEEELRENYPPSDFESYFPLAKATLHNAKLCAQKKR
jgi:hypothetical protein